MDTAIAVLVGQLRLALSRFSDRIQYEDQPACSREDLLLRLNTYRPHILQISGHGDLSGAIALMHPVSGDASKLTPRDLGKLLGDRPELRLLVLDCCHGGTGVGALGASVGAVIAARGSIREPYPIAFAVALHHSIASGRSLQAAFDDAVVTSAERAEGSTEFDLLTSGVDPRSLFLCARGQGSSAHARRLEWRLWAACLVVGAGIGTAAATWLVPAAPRAEERMSTSRQP